MFSRRQFLAGGFSAGLTARLSTPALAQAKPKVVVIGGGAGGLTVLRALASAANGKLELTLIEPQKTYTACFHSNLYLGGFERLANLQYGYDAVKALPGVTVAQDAALAINRAARKVTLASGPALPYDRLVVAPGIDLDYGSVPGWAKEAEERMPHAWKGGAQLELLKQQLDAVPDGGVIVILAPPNPYRCPPGPYERASMMAHNLKAGGKTNAHIMIIDAKEVFSKQPLFQQGWEQHYPGMIEWLPPSIHSGVHSIDPVTMTVETGFETYKNAALVNVIPKQTAGRIAKDAGLVGDHGYCPIDPFTLKSRMDPNIFVLGDACIAGDMAKSAFAANSQGHIAAGIIASELLDGPRPEVEYRNECWSLLDTEDSVKIGGTYRPSNVKIQEASSFISKMDEPSAVRREQSAQSAAWFTQITHELFD